MTNPPIKAKALEKPPAAKPLPSKWLPDSEPGPSVNDSYEKVPRQFVPRRKRKSPRYNFVCK